MSSLERCFEEETRRSADLRIAGTRLSFFGNNTELLLHGERAYLQFNFETYRADIKMTVFTEYSRKFCSISSTFRLVRINLAKRKR